MGSGCDGRIAGCCGSLGLDLAANAALPECPPFPGLALPFMALLGLRRCLS